MAATSAPGGVGTLSTTLFLAGAGVLAGIIGSAGGITSLVSYAALLVVGVPPLAANVTNSVALLGSGSGAAARAPHDLPFGQVRRVLREWAPTTVACSLAGAALLVLTPADVFARIAPFLIAFGSLVLLCQPWIAASIRRRSIGLSHRAIVAAWALIALYNGYFGAGSGILVIALLLLTSEPVLYRANALKNVIVIVSDVLPAVLFAIAGTVVWHALWPLTAGAILGGLLGPGITRRVPAEVMRPLIAGFGLGCAIWLAISP